MLLQISDLRKVYNENGKPSMHPMYSMYVEIEKEEDLYNLIIENEDLSFFMFGMIMSQWLKEMNTVPLDKFKIEFSEYYNNIDNRESLRSIFHFEIIALDNLIEDNKGLLYRVNNYKTYYDSWSIPMGEIIDKSYYIRANNIYELTDKIKTNNYKDYLKIRFECIENDIIKLSKVK